MIATCTVIATSTSTPSATTYRQYNLLVPSKFSCLSFYWMMPRPVQWWLCWMNSEIDFMWEETRARESAGVLLIIWSWQSSSSSISLRGPGGPSANTSLYFWCGWAVKLSANVSQNSNDFTIRPDSAQMQIRVTSKAESSGSMTQCRLSSKKYALPLTFISWAKAFYLVKQISLLLTQKLILSRTLNSGSYFSHSARSLDLIQSASCLEQGVQADANPTTSKYVNSTPYPLIPLIYYKYSNARAKGSGAGLTT